MAVNFGGVTLHVPDVEQALTFYAQIPGADLMVHRPGEFALLRIGRGRLGLLRREHGAFHLEFDCDDLDATYTELKAAGLATKGGPTTKPWGERDLLIRDPHGNMVEFGEAEAAAERSRPGSGGEGSASRAGGWTGAVNPSPDR
ncbi:MAG: VOC family protein [Chloroflexota bacterium]|nr:VOC family protein [Chloroflexota bacterium]